MRRETYKPKKTQKLSQLISGSFGSAHALALVEKGADPCVQAKNGQTLLHILAKNNKEGDNFEAMRSLISRGVDVNIKNRQGLTPLENLTGRIGYSFSEVRDLLTLGADLRRVNLQSLDLDGQTILHRLMVSDYQGFDSRLKELFKTTQKIDFPDEHNVTPLQKLKRNSKYDRLIQIFKLGLDPNVLINGETLLHHLVRNNKAGELNSYIRTLVEDLKANINALDSQGLTPLDLLFLSWEDSVPTVSTIVFLQSFGAVNKQSAMNGLKLIKPGKLNIQYLHAILKENQEQKTNIENYAELTHKTKDIEKVIDVDELYKYTEKHFNALAVVRLSKIFKYVPQREQSEFLVVKTREGKKELITKGFYIEDTYALEFLQIITTPEGEAVVYGVDNTEGYLWIKHKNNSYVSQCREISSYHDLIENKDYKPTEKFAILDANVLVNPLSNVKYFVDLKLNENSKDEVGQSASPLEFVRQQFAILKQAVGSIHDEDDMKEAISQVGVLDKIFNDPQLTLEQARERVQHVFKMRWTIIPSSHLSYDINSASCVNQYYLVLAQILFPDDFYAKLMPTLECTEDPTFLADISELLPGQFILTRDGKSFIPLAALYEQGRRFVFELRADYLYIYDKELYDKDRSTSRHLFPEEIKVLKSLLNFYSEFDQAAKLSVENIIINMTLYDVFLEFKKCLQRAEKPAYGTSGGLGTGKELDAGKTASEGLIWLMEVLEGLPEHTRKKLENIEEYKSIMERVIRTPEDVNQKTPVPRVDENFQQFPVGHWTINPKFCVQITGNNIVSEFLEENEKFLRSVQVMGSTFEDWSQAVNLEQDLEEYYRKINTQIIHTFDVCLKDPGEYPIHLANFIDFLISQNQLQLLIEFCNPKLKSETGDLNTILESEERKNIIHQTINDKSLLRWCLDSGNYYFAAWLLNMGVGLASDELAKIHEIRKEHWRICFLSIRPDFFSSIEEKLFQSAIKVKDLPKECTNQLLDFLNEALEEFNIKNVRLLFSILKERRPLDNGRVHDILQKIMNNIIFELAEIIQDLGFRYELLKNNEKIYFLKKLFCYVLRVMSKEGAVRISDWNLMKQYIEKIEEFDFDENRSELYEMFSDLIKLINLTNLNDTQLLTDLISKGKNRNGFLLHTFLLLLTNGVPNQSRSISIFKTLFKIYKKELTIDERRELISRYVEQGFYPVEDENLLTEIVADILGDDRLRFGSSGQQPLLIFLASNNPVYIAALKQPLTPDIFDIVFPRWWRGLATNYQEYFRRALESAAKNNAQIFLRLAYLADFEDNKAVDLRFDNATFDLSDRYRDKGLLDCLIKLKKPQALSRVLNAQSVKNSNKDIAGKFEALLLLDLNSDKELIKILSEYVFTQDYVPKPTSNLITHFRARYKDQLVKAINSNEYVKLAFAAASGMQIHAARTAGFEPSLFQHAINQEKPECVMQMLLHAQKNHFFSKGQMKQAGEFLAEKYKPKNNAAIEPGFLKIMENENLQSSQKRQFALSYCYKKIAGFSTSTQIINFIEAVIAHDGCRRHLVNRSNYDFTANLFAYSWKSLSENSRSFAMSSEFNCIIEHAKVGILKEHSKSNIPTNEDKKQSFLNQHRTPFTLWANTTRSMKKYQENVSKISDEYCHRLYEKHSAHSEGEPDPLPEKLLTHYVSSR